ncbi:MAG TPA: hypothetical protein VG755_16465 [Nannocystaceae bacterium]|nr:hypothetical protein [Nannocystaceae bacterium]
MPRTHHRLFHVLVVLGAAATAAAACDRDATKSPEPTPREPAPRTASEPAGDRTADARTDRSADANARDDAACTCEGEGPQCTADGVMCCWAHGDCCPTCCA